MYRRRTKTRTRNRSRTRSRSPDPMGGGKDYLDAMIDIAEYVEEHDMVGWDLNFMQHPSSTWPDVARYWNLLPRDHPILVDRLVRLADYLDGTAIRDYLDSILEWLIIRVSHLRDSINRNPKDKLRLLKDQRELMEETLTYRMDPQDGRSQAIQTQIALVERLQRDVLTDVQTERLLMTGQIGPSWDASLLIRGMATGENSYRMEEPMENEFDRLIKDIGMLHERGFTVDDFFNGKVYPEVLELYRRLEKANVYWMQPPEYMSLRGHVEEAFNGLQTRDMGQLLEHLTDLANQGMTLDEFRRGWGPHWERLSPETAESVKRIYARYRGYEDDFRDLEDEINTIFMLHEGESVEEALMERIPFLVQTGIDFTGLLYGLDVTALEWFDVIRHQPGAQTRVKQAFERARQRLIDEFLPYMERIGAENPDVSFQGFLRGNADVSFFTQSQAERFRFLFERVQEFPEYQQLQKRMKSFFRRSRSG